MSRRQQWSPYAVPHIRDNFVRGASELVESSDLDAMRAASAGHHDESNEFYAVADYHERCTETALDAELFWVAADMADIALDASQDMPGLTEQDVRWPLGFMLFEKPLPPQTTAAISAELRSHPLVAGLPDELTAEVPIDGLLWCPEDGGVRIDVLVRASRIPELALRPGMTVTAYASARLPLPADFTDDGSFLGGAGTAPGPLFLGLAAFLGAAWHLMAMPAVARARDVQPRTGESRAAESVTVPVGQVRVVDARPMRTVPADPEETAGSEDGGRRYSARWVVRGHWRQQAHGPGRSQRRTQWIESYIKGPEDAPLAPHTLVRAWRR